MTLDKNIYMNKILYGTNVPYNISSTEISRKSLIVAQRADNREYQSVSYYTSSDFGITFSIVSLEYASRMATMV